MPAWNLNDCNTCKYHSNKACQAPLRIDPDGKANYRTGEITSCCRTGHGLTNLSNRERAVMKTALEEGIPLGAIAAILGRDTP